METELLKNPFVIGILSAFLGSGLTIVVQRILAKRGLFTYSVLHSRIGVSADDEIFGNVRVVWKTTELANLYLSTVELTNESLSDYENVVVRVFTGNTKLLTEQTEIVGTSWHPERTKDYQDRLAVSPGDSPSDQQWDLYFRQREYLVPTMNRGQRYIAPL